MTLSQETIRIVKSTAPVLAEHGETITKHFYQQMFSHNPELLDVFNSSNQHTGDQPRALAAAVYAYAANIDNLGALTGAVERIAHKHASFNIKPEQYPIVGQHLLAAVAHVLGDAASEEIVNAWTEAYQFLANLFIEVEEGIYRESEKQSGGWRGTREFRVAKKVRESEIITSFYFEPVDGQPVADFLPGQYIGIYLNPKGHKYQEIRQYSLSDAPNGKSYRISVKREINGEHEGLISNYLHDQVNEGDVVELSPPNGDFYLAPNNDHPVVLLSGGVGQTPVLSMLNTLISKNNNQQIRYIHSAVNSDVHAFGMHIDTIANANDHIEHILFYDHADSNEGNHYIGQTDLNLIRDQIDMPNAHYYFCGPIGYMSMVNSTLTEWGIPEDRIHYEVFGPHKSL